MRRKGLLTGSIALLVMAWLAAVPSGCSDSDLVEDTSGLRGYSSPCGGDNPFESCSPQDNPYGNGQPSENPYGSNQPQDNAYENNQPQDNPNESSDSSGGGGEDDLQELADQIEDIMDQLDEAEDDPAKMEDLLNQLDDLLDYDLMECIMGGGEPCAYECCEEGTHCDYDTGQCTGGDSSDGKDSDGGDINQDLEDFWEEMAQADDLSELEDLAAELEEELGYDIMDCVMNGGMPCLEECCLMGDMCNFETGKCESSGS